MNDNRNPYPRSSMPPARSTTGIEATRQPISPNTGRTLYDTTRALQTARNKGRAIITPEDRGVSYPSMIQYTKLSVPRPDGDLRAGSFDEILAKDLGRHVSARVKEGFRISPSEAVNTLHHYVGAVKGLQLFDAASMADFEKLASRFAASPSGESFSPIEQFLGALVPSERGAE